MPQPDEISLLRAVQQRDRQAQAEFYQLYKRRMMGICRRYTRLTQEAEDLFQECIIRVFNQIDTVRQPESVEAWVRSIVIRTAINHYRSEAAAGQPVPLTEADEPLTDAESELLAKLSEEELIRLINALPDGYRTVFNLYVIDGYTHADISKMLNIQESTSKSQLTRAKALVRRQLRQLHPFAYGTCTE